ncbi:hypothetical protein LR48_Vigan09g234900 [Vigna angularis]|uniref:Uncharacterized protein n=1 Tax=Phaseolus angularis TaxID=3914 RepID=A0A0L9VF60_PHAAN|nr:hypothetical protein LR48_Vigan09g234900 [Vigna angularis]
MYVERVRVLAKPHHRATMLPLTPSQVHLLAQSNLHNHHAINLQNIAPSLFRIAEPPSTFICTFSSYGDLDKIKNASKPKSCLVLPLLQPCLLNHNGACRKISNQNRDSPL